METFTDVRNFLNVSISAGVSENSSYILLKRSRIRVVQMDNFRGLLGISRMNIVLNAWIRKLCRVKMGIDERIDEGTLQWLRHVERMENEYMIAKRVYVGECAGICSLGRPWKRLIGTVKECLRKKKFEHQASKENSARQV